MPALVLASTAQEYHHLPGGFALSTQARRGLSRKGSNGGLELIISSDGMAKRARVSNGLLWFTSTF